MAASNTLLDIIAHLQQHISAAHGRRMLLDYARKSARARLGLLFRVDTARQKLILVEQCGHAPQYTLPSEHVEIGLNGLFGSALHQGGLLSVADSYSVAQSLPAEHSWTWHGGRVVMSAIETIMSDVKGVMVLCAGPKASKTPLTIDMEREVLLCTSLLATYLGGDREEGALALPSMVPVITMAGDASVPQVTTAGDASVPPQPHTTPAPTVVGALLPKGEMMWGGRFYDLSTLYEMGLLVNANVDEQAFHQSILEYLAQTLRAAGGCLWLYQPSQARFVFRASCGEHASYLKLVADELAGLARERENVEGKVSRALRIVTWSSERVVILHSLECMGQLVGAVAFALKKDLTAEQRALCATMCHVAAVILRNQQVRIAEQQATIDQERSRIAREIHDSAAQDIAHVLHILELVQRIFERQPQAALRELRRARERLVESLNDLRSSISSLLPAQLEKSSFDDALRGLLDEFSKSEPAIALHYEVARLKHWPPSLEVPLYRVLQEALHNVRKHAHATYAAVHIQTLPSMLIVQVSDNGTGFDVEEAHRDAAQNGSSVHFGLRMMQERVEQAGGTLEIVSKPGAGTTLKARFPLLPLAASLTNREREVLRLLVDGSTNRMIAVKLSVSIETVKSHVRHIMQKLHVKDRTQAAVMATKQQWI
ncbi:MAG: hypothetical protein E6I32_06020 [Chloroflexi bacterium]|nr:MAG: hypothetical protein E6I32_06020 [Chloroflexota bacterium]